MVWILTCKWSKSYVVIISICWFFNPRFPSGDSVCAPNYWGARNLPRHGQITRRLEFRAWMMSPPKRPSSIIVCSPSTWFVHLAESTTLQQTTVMDQPRNRFDTEDQVSISSVDSVQPSPDTLSRAYKVIFVTRVTYIALSELQYRADQKTSRVDL